MIGVNRLTLHGYFACLKNLSGWSVVPFFLSLFTYIYSILPLMSESLPKSTMQNINNPLVQPAADTKVPTVSANNRMRRWYQWHEPGTSKEEKRLIFKLDVFILTYTCLVCPVESTV